MGVRPPGLFIATCFETTKHELSRTLTISKQNGHNKPILWYKSCLSDKRRLQGNNAVYHGIKTCKPCWVDGWEAHLLNNETQSETCLELFQVSRQFIPREVLIHSRNSAFQSRTSDTIQSRDGAVVRTPASLQYHPGLIPAWCHMWVEFGAGSRLAPRISSLGSPVFLLPLYPKIQFDQDRRTA